MTAVRVRQGARLTLGALLLAFQIYIILHPQPPLVERPMHLVMVIGLVLLWRPLDEAGVARRYAWPIDGLLLLGVLAAAVYYVVGYDRLAGRMEGIDLVLVVDQVIGLVLILALFEGVRRAVGWSLLGVILVFVAYGFLGPWFPGWLRFGGFSPAEFTENLTMTANGVLGITTATSVQFVFYFVAFAAIYAAIGGGQLFIDIGSRLTGRYQGGAAKAAVVSSSLMGSISGSAVANVAATGVFTIPLMRNNGYTAERAAATEAIASTGGQLMPPIMGIAAFVMAELLQIPYARIALAGLIPALAFYVALFLAVDLDARKRRAGALTEADVAAVQPILPRLHLLLPPVVLIGMLVAGYSATYSALIATASCLLACHLRRSSWLSPRDWLRALARATKQAADVAVPIAAIGVIIAVAIQSNLALKFSTRLIDLSGGTLLGAMAMIILGCIVMGMGLPTVAAYIIGAILFVPALLELGIPELSAHFFVMYYCVLSMVTPPVALASYAAAGIAGANSLETSLLAFRLSLVSFFIPFAFAFDPALLADAAPARVLFAVAALALATAGWAIALEGYLLRPLSLLERLPYGLAAVTVIFAPTGSWPWAVAAFALIGLFARSLITARRTRPALDPIGLSSHDR